MKSHKLFSLVDIREHRCYIANGGIIDEKRSYFGYAIFGFVVLRIRIERRQGFPLTWQQRLFFIKPLE